MTLKIVCVATHSEGYFPAYKQSCEKNNISLTILGFGKKWKGLTQKLNLLREFLEKCENDDIIIFTDAYDVICLEEGDIILKKFLSLNKPIVMGKHSTLIQGWDVTELIFEKCENCVINTGGYMGYAKNLKQLFNQLFLLNNCDESNLTDQKLINKFCNQDPFIKENVKIDKEGLIFFNATCLEISKFLSTKTCDIGLKIKGKNIINPLTKLSPSFLHGPANVNLDIYCELLGYPIATNKRNQFLWVLKNYKKDILKYLGIIFLIIFLIILTFIIVRKKVRGKS